MPTAEEHIQKYKHNRDFYAFGIASGQMDFSDWKVTVLFYAAVHLIEAILHQEYQEDAGDHKKRDELMIAHEEIFPHDSRRRYIQLRALSQKARYKAEPITQKEVGFAQDWLGELELDYRRYIA